VLIPHEMAESRAAFAKLGLRRYLVISIVMVAATIAVGGDGRIDRARVAVGACSPVARRLRDLEASLVSRSVDEDLGALVRSEHLSALEPIDDVRATAEYRREAALTLVRRTLASCGGQR
jgi:CO/xanthine dehydrogenase FAD-binding subunit